MIAIMMGTMDIHNSESQKSKRLEARDGWLFQWTLTHEIRV